MKKHPTDRLTQRVSTHLTGAEDAELSRHLERVGKARTDWLREAIGEKMEREETCRFKCREVNGEYWYP